MMHTAKIGRLERLLMNRDTVIGKTLELWPEVNDRTCGLRRECTERAGEIGDVLSMLVMRMRGMKQVRGSGQQNEATTGDGENRCCALCFRPHIAVLPQKNTLACR